MPKKHNSYYYFMLDWKKRQEVKGYTFPNGLNDVSANQNCSEEWQSMTKQQKGPFVRMAKDGNIAAQISNDKKTTLGESLREIEEMEKKEKKFEEKMHQYIDSIISMAFRHNNLEKLKFIFIHVNWFFKREYGVNKCDYYPAEFAVAEFSLENGIEKVYHEIINCKIPLGFRRDAVETSQQSHQIPIELPDGQSDYRKMFKDLITFLQPHMNENKFPPIFTPNTLKPVVESLLLRMTEDSEVDTNEFLIYSLEALFHVLRNTAGQSTEGIAIPLVLASNEFAKELFSSVRGIECTFHRNIDGTTRFCSQSLVRQWGFTICDYCCELLDIKMIPGIHCPHTIYNNSEIVDRTTMDISFSRLNISAQKPSLLSMTGVSEEYRIKASERTYKEEQERRKASKTIEVIDHSKLLDAQFQISGTSSVSGRPLRLPNTISNAAIGIQEIAEDNINEAFPPLGGGRGVPRKSKQLSDIVKLPLGRGHGKR